MCILVLYQYTPMLLYMKCIHISLLYCVCHNKGKRTGINYRGGSAKRGTGAEAEAKT